MRKSFIHTVNSQNIFNLKEDLEAKSEGINSFYVVDTFDVIETCFPSLYTNGANTNKNLEIAVYLATQHLFFESENQPVILDEYKIEIFSFWANIHNKLERNYKIGKGKIIKNLIEKFNSLNSNSEISRFVEDEIGLLLSVSINTINVTPYERFDQLIKGRLQINKFKCHNQNDTILLNYIFQNAKPETERIKEIYKNFVDDNKYYLSSLQSEEIYVYLENSLRDIKVFDRILTINQKLEKEYQNQNLRDQYRLLYLSSVPQKSSVIQRLYIDLNHKIQVNSEIGFLTSTNIHRSNMDIHLNDLITSSITENADFDISKLTTDLSKLVEGDDYELFKFETEVPVKRQKRNDLLDYSKLESLFYINKTIRGHLDDLKSTLSKLKTDKKRTGEQELSSVLKDCLTLLDDENLDKNTEKIRSIVEIHNDALNAHFDIYNTLKTSILRGKTLTYKFKSTNDSVKSIIQSFPILLFYRLKGKENLYRSVKDIISKFILHSNSDSKSIKYAPQSIGIYTGLYLELYSMLLSLLLDSPNKINKGIILTRLSDLKIKASKIKMNSNLIHDNGIVKYDMEITSDNLFQAEIDYFEVWYLRRLGEYSEGVKLAEKCFAKYNDARFLHGKALCLKSIYYSSKKSKNSKHLEKLLNDSIIYFKQSEKLFSKIKKKKDFLFEHTKLAISNSICDSYVQLSILDNMNLNYITHIEESRSRIDSISLGLLNLNGDILNHPAYCHTACEIYLESARLELLNSRKSIAKKYYDLSRKYFVQIQEKEQLRNHLVMPETFKRFNRIGLKLYS